jgi:hypothetical protein
MIAYYSAMTCGREMNANMTDELNAPIVAMTIFSRQKRPYNPNNGI